MCPSMLTNHWWEGMFYLQPLHKLNVNNHLEHQESYSLSSRGSWSYSDVSWYFGVLRELSAGWSQLANGCQPGDNPLRIWYVENHKPYIDLLQFLLYVVETSSITGCIYLFKFLIVLTSGQLFYHQESAMGWTAEPTGIFEQTAPGRTSVFHLVDMVRYGKSHGPKKNSDCGSWSLHRFILGNFGEKKSGKPWVVQIAGISWKVWNGWNRIPPWDDDFNRDWLHWRNILEAENYGKNHPVDIHLGVVNHTLECPHPLFTHT